MAGRRVLTWHVHGSYLDSLARTGLELYLPVRSDGTPGYGGRAGRDWPGVVREVPAENVRDLEVDAVLFQSARNWLEDGPAILSAAQLRGPRLYVEHDPPRQHPTDTRHVVDDPEVLLVHVTAFNDLMWDSGRTPTRVIEHGVAVPEDVRYSGELERGIVVVNNLASRGRRLGRDVFESARREVPLDLIGMDGPALGGFDALPLAAMPAFIARYRFFFHPIRYTSFGMAVCEAMMVGLPVVALATTEMPTVIETGVSGFIDTSVPRLVAAMKELIADPALARRVGDAARAVARERFSIDRFARDWTAALDEVVGRRTSRPAAAIPAGVPR